MSPPAPSLDAGPSAARAQRRLRAGTVAAWLLFSALMAWVSAQDHVRNGGHEPWRPIFYEFTSMLVGAGLLVLQWRWWAPRLDAWLDRPFQWFARALAWLPLVAPLFVWVVFQLRGGLLALAGRPYWHDPWGEALLYECPKFAIFFALFSAVLFGWRSYQAWLAERLRAERLQAMTQQAQLLQLTQQLQPHFLFNALNTISALIHSDPDRADALLGRLAALLRAATDVAHRPTQPLADELALVRGYADIMLERFGDRARLQWQVDEALVACPVPTLALQVLLENAFKHAVEPRRAATHLVVQAVGAPGRLTLSVQDDGGMLTLAHAPAGVGLANLRRRLAALHGDAAGLALQPVPGGGVRAELWLPCAC